MKAAGAGAAARRRLQAAHLALRLPGPRRGGPRDPGRGARGDGPADRHRGDGRPRGRDGRRGTPTSSRSAPATCRTSACWERSAGTDRPVLLKRGLSLHDRGAAARGRVHPARRATTRSCSASAASAPSRRRPATPSTSRRSPSSSGSPPAGDRRSVPRHRARRLIPPIARAAVAAGADGLIVEVHPAPEDALSRRAAVPAPETFAAWVADIRRCVDVMGKVMAGAEAAVA